MIDDFVEEFAGRPVVDYDDLIDFVPSRAALRVFEVEQLFALADRWHEIEALILALSPSANDGPTGADWAHLWEIVLPQLTNLEALFCGEVVKYQSELSQVVGYEPEGLARLHQLRHLALRGRGPYGHNHARRKPLDLTPLDTLESLTLEASGLYSETWEALWAIRHHRHLEHLTLWLGDLEQGGDWYFDWRPDERFTAFLRGEGFPALRRLGLRNADRQSLEGHLNTLIASPRLQTLRELDLQDSGLHDVCSVSAVSALIEAAPQGMSILLRNCCFSTPEVKALSALAQRHQVFLGDVGWQRNWTCSAYYRYAEHIE